MRQKRAAGTGGGEKTIRDIRGATRRQYSAEEKVRIVLDGLRGEDSIAELCRRELTPETQILELRPYVVSERQSVPAFPTRLASNCSRANSSDGVSYPYNQSFG